MTRVPIAPIPIAEPATIRFTIQEAMACNLHHKWDAGAGAAELSFNGMSTSVGVCLTYVMASNDPMTAHPAGSTLLDTRLDENTQTGEPTVAHIVKVEPGESAQAKVMEARIYGTPLEALCGHVWVPSRDPKKLPMCEDCKSIYEMYRMMNDELNDQPSD